ncbi:flagellar basal body M-ring protein FliF [Stagnimonas aquatica]|uniref:Flagellar M-ring protein n=1 Tax=Stagnimonas aquatica TaxID=2689987 RepID=A0A3N0V5L2_9GAMM|nr:flagellar basal-body MS-ring/collar protein FliF [Stagnimonas aquatica]ROH87851.1 flagellar basal body M-ring protein FliF [Stagnimonas aquatica]
MRDAVLTPDQPDNLRSLGERVRAIPGLSQLLLLTGLAAAIAAGLSLFMWSRAPGFQPLYSGLPEQDVALMADALTAAGIENRVDPDTGALTVPAAQLRAARLKLAGQGLPKAGGVGFEAIRGEQGFGVSQFIESARYQNALETELVRTISALQPVKSARVHLAIPKASAFARGRSTPSASVLVELHPGRTLTAQQVASIVHVVSSSVPELPASAVTVVDQAGDLLTDDSRDSAGALTSSQFEHVRRVEDDYTRRVQEILRPLTGSGRISAQVVADMDFTAAEQTEEQYQPNPQAIRSEQTREERDAAVAARGVPGATSNKPPEVAPPVAAAAPAASDPNSPVASTAPTPPVPAATAGSGVEASGPQSRSSSRNYEIDKTVRYSKQAPGRIQRLSVAVLVDYLPRPDGKGGMVPSALKPEELSRMEALVKEAVGFDAQRGDSVTVQNAPFAPTEAYVEPELPLLERPELRDVAREALGALVLLVLIIAVVRPLMRNLFGGPDRKVLTPEQLAALAPPEVAAGVPGTLAALPGQGVPALAQGEDELPLPAPAASVYDQRLERARQAVREDPKRVAQVMRAWIAQE